MPPEKKRKTKPGSHESEDGVVTKQGPSGSETFVLFYGPNTVYSNFYPSKFMIDGVEFNCGEQYFHYAKAVLFKDDETAQKILKTNSPREQKSLGRQVKNYDEKKWGEAGPRAMKDGIKAKFEQNADMRATLLSTVGKTLVEASPRDRKWGIGLGVHNPKAVDRSQWRGRNLLGQILMEVREELRNSSSAASASSGASADA